MGNFEMVQNIHFFCYESNLSERLGSLKLWSAGCLVEAMDLLVVANI